MVLLGVRTADGNGFAQSAAAVMGGSQVIKVVRPRLHHPAAFGKVLGVVVNCSDSIPFSMRKLALDGIATPTELV